MQLNRLPVLSLLALLVFTSCKKNFSEELPIVDPSPYPLDLSVKVNTAVSGFIINESNEPVFSATVSAGGKTVYTDEYGYFKISDVSLPKVAGTVSISKAGYFNTVKTFMPEQNKESFVRSRLLTKSATGNFDASAGGTVSTIDGAKIIFPAASIVTTTGTLYSGRVNVSARTMDFSTPDDMQLSAPGDKRGVDTAGNLHLLRSRAAIVVELSADNGTKLQIAPGKKANLTIPVIASQRASAPASVAIWYLNEHTGIWSNETTGTKNGDSYVAEVSHFSFWEGADPSLLVNFKTQIVSENLQPLANVPVTITVAGQPANSGYSTFGFTNAEGVVSGPVLANSSLVLDIRTACATGAYSHNFTTVNSDVDLGTLTGNLGQAMVSITGNVVNCQGQPVINGYVQTFDGSFYNRITVTNGNFSFTGLACTNSNIHYVAVDKATNQQGDVRSATLTPGANNFGSIVACGVSTLSILNYSYDGVAYSFSDPEDTLAAFKTEAPSTQIVKLDNAVNNSPIVSFEVRGTTTIGGPKTIYDIWLPQFPSGRGVNLNGIPVYITEYGPVGGFIAGYSPTFEVRDFGDSSLHVISLNFRIKRYF